MHIYIYIYICICIHTRICTHRCIRAGSAGHTRLSLSDSARPSSALDFPLYMVFPFLRDFPF